MNEPSAQRQFINVLFFSAVAAVGGFLFGYDTAVINGTVEALQQAFGSTTLGTGFSASSMLIGCAIGALAAGTAADRVGRRPVMIVSSLGFLISALGSGWSTSLSEFVIYRLLGGLAVGAASVIAPAYIAEIAPAKLRGRLASLQQLAIVVGIFVALLCNYAIAASSGGAKENWLAGWPAWSWMFWMECIPSIAYFGLLLFIPESPRYLVARQREEEAKGILETMVAEDQVSGMISSIKESLHGERKPQFGDVFQPGSWSLQPMLWVGISLAALQQLSGINVIFYYGAVLWQSAGFSEADALKINVVSGIVNVTSTFVAMALIDKIGRKPLLLGGSLVMAVSLGTIAFVFFQAAMDQSGNLTLSSQQGWLALVCAHVYIFGFGTTWGPCIWVLLSELFDNRIRGNGMAVATFVLWMTNFAIIMLFPTMLKTIGLGNSYLIFAGFAILSFFFVVTSIHETSGKTLEALAQQSV